MGAYLTKEQHISVNLFIDEEQNKVLFAQAGKDFMDVLLSFFTLPLGTIARLVSQKSNIQKVRVGSISSLYDSVVNIDENLLWTPVCKEMLLRPRNSMEKYCQHIKLNIDETEKIKYFICEDLKCSRPGSSSALLSTFKNQRCKCGKPMNREIFFDSPSTNSKIEYDGFVQETASFIISDDLSVKADTSGGLIFESRHVPNSLDLNDIKQVTINVTRKEILDLLKCSLFSMSPLTDVFLRKSLVTRNTNTQSFSLFDSEIGELKPKSRQRRIRVKLLVRMSSKTILFALGGEDFVNLLFSFLTFPLGAVKHLLNGNSNMGSIDNLYKCIPALDRCKFLRLPYLKDMLLKTELAHQFKICNQMLPIDEAPARNYACLTKNNIYGEISTSLVPSSGGSIWTNVYESVHLRYLEPQSSTGEAYNRSGGRGFTKIPSLYMVTDDLVLTPGSSTCAFSVLAKLRIPVSDVMECGLLIGETECLSILKASLISTSALTNGLSEQLKRINNRT